MENFLTTQKAVRTLLTAARTGGAKQAYIFEGMRGIGRFTAARVFAAALQCEREAAPCLACPSCKKVLSATHPDVCVFGENAPIRVGDIRALTDELYIKPAISATKVFIVKNADTMNSDAQNALLKSFEEPPAYAVIILLSENVQNLLPTIRSRGVKITFEPFSEEEIMRFTRECYPEKGEYARFVSRYCGGIIGKAKDICENADFFNLREKMFGAVSSLTGDKLSIFSVAELFDIKRGGKAAFIGCDVYFELFLSFMRDVLALKTGKPPINEDLLEYIEDFAKKTARTAVVNVIERTSQTRRMLNVSMKYELWIVNMLIKCWEDIHGKGSRS